MTLLFGSVIFYSYIYNSLKILIMDKEIELQIVSGGASFGETIRPMTVTPITGKFSNKRDLWSFIFNKQKVSKFKTLEEFLKNCVTDQYELVCLYPDLPVGRLNGDLTTYNYNSKVGSNPIHFKSPTEIIIDVEWVGHYNVKDYFVIKLRD